MHLRRNNQYHQELEVYGKGTIHTGLYNLFEPNGWLIYCNVGDQVAWVDFKEGMRKIWWGGLIQYDHYKKTIMIENELEKEHPGTGANILTNKKNIYIHIQ